MFAQLKLIVKIKEKKTDPDDHTRMFSDYSRHLPPALAWAFAGYHLLPQRIIVHPKYRLSGLIY